MNSEVNIQVTEESSSRASNHCQWCLLCFDAIVFSINTVYVLFIKITLIQDCKDPLELMEAEMNEEELDVQDEVWSSSFLKKKKCI